LIEVRDGKHFQDLLTVHKVVLVDFYADWCGPCRRLKPILGEIADAYVGRAVTVSVNVDHLKDVAELYGVSGVPDVRVFVDGKISEVIVGLRTREAYVNALEKAGIPRKAG
jgi:thioredoxin